jgi:hypothetical protein
MKNNNDSHRIEIDIDDLVLQTFNNIVTWNNIETNSKDKQDRLKILSDDIIQMCLNAFGNSLGVDVDFPGEERVRLLVDVYEMIVIWYNSKDGNDRGDSDFLKITSEAAVKHCLEVFSTTFSLSTGFKYEGDTGEAGKVKSLFNKLFNRKKKK